MDLHVYKREGNQKQPCFTLKNKREFRRIQNGIH